MALWVRIAAALLQDFLPEMGLHSRCRRRRSSFAGPPHQHTPHDAAHLSMLLVVLQVSFFTAFLQAFLDPVSSHGTRLPQHVSPHFLLHLLVLPLLTFFLHFLNTLSLKPAHAASADGEEIGGGEAPQVQPEHAQP